MSTFFFNYLFWIAYGVSNLAAVLLMIACYKRPVVARLGFAVLFGWASWFNVSTVLETPWVYTDFADYALLGYRWFILGPFQKLVAPVVLAIALGQLMIAASMPLMGRFFKLGCLGGLLFSAAILPLGLGSAFPAMVFIAVGFYRLYQHPADRLLWKRSSGRSTRQLNLTLHN
ncbi:hypothetical protein GO755_28090 [Spirosoma sp. HMF4905]|uniref:Uncharacterized protein n=1 Tax=Spirosoma arboris TaxID=2682092 RepID=A0A7K1SJD5_9BACT|nr:hypothetical protein [Spirosoma arboris]MVM33929.1 hypothetical protein [Spirosoma arboris]